MSALFKVGQRVILLPIPRDTIWNRTKAGTVTIITKLNAVFPTHQERMHPGVTYHEIALIGAHGHRTVIAARFLQPIKGDDTELGSWDTINSLLGFDMRESNLQRAVKEIERLL